MSVLFFFYNLSLISLHSVCCILHIYNFWKICFKQFCIYTDGLLTTVLASCLPLSHLSTSLSMDAPSHKSHYLMLTSIVLWHTEFNQGCLCSYGFQAIFWILVALSVGTSWRKLFLLSKNLLITCTALVECKSMWPLLLEYLYDWLFTGTVLCGHNIYSHTVVSLWFKRLYRFIIHAI